MSKVHILSKDVVSKIAAGEVIERPSSVVKELVENALDAGADTIEVMLKDAGKTLIALKDNGSGIDEDDLDKIFLRHATSKIKQADDLVAIQSLGFRGEALYSMAAIADVSLKSKTSTQDSGWEIHLRGGQKINLRPLAMGTNGTEIEITELFFNTPARKKFLKSNTTEINQILNVFLPYTFLNSQTRFRLNHQSRVLIDLPPCENLISRYAHALNLDEQYLHDVKEDIPEKGCSIRMLLGDINIKRTRRDMQYIFVNNRPVQNKSISYHMNQIYRLIMPGDAFPFFAVYIHLPPQDLDVNIHPTKREIKIKWERELCSWLRSMCEKHLMKSGQLKQVKRGDENKTPFESVPRAMIPTHSSEVTFDEATPSETAETGQTALKYSDDYAYPKAQSPTGTPGVQDFFIPQEHILTQSKETLQSKLEKARFIGSFLNKFLLFESGKSLLVVDQHAAAERITFEQIIEHMHKGNLEVQNLLAPVIVKLTPQEMLIWEESQEDLTKLGLDTNLFDETAVAIQAYPELLKDPEKALRHVLAGEKIERSDFETIARRACRSSIMAGDNLTKEQAEYQREVLLNCLDPFTCPHGRPTVIEMSEGFLDKQFLRTK